MLSHRHGLRYLKLLIWGGTEKCRPDCFIRSDFRCAAFLNLARSMARYFWRDVARLHTFIAPVHVISRNRP